MKRLLTDTAIRNAKPTPEGKPQKYTDGGGLYLLVSTVGKYWRYDYRHDGKRKTLAIGVYPTLSLKAAREKHDEARAQLKQGTDPSHHQKASRSLQAVDGTFEAVAREWIERYLTDKSASHRTRTVSYLERDVFPHLGARPVALIKPPELIPIIDRIHKRVARDSHLRTLQTIGQVLRYAIATGRREDPDPTPSLKGLFPPRELLTHFPALTDPIEVGRLLRAIDHYAGNFVTKCALQLSALVMMRQGAFIRAEWQEINFETAMWVIEVKHMKADTKVKRANREEDKHVIPLSRQALTILRELYPLTGYSRFVFQSPNIRGGKDAPMSSETVTKALYRMGFKGEMTGHGYRSMASTLLNDMRRPDGGRMWDADAIERQLGHKDKDPIRSAYNRGQYLEERRRMLQHWADYLDQLQAGAQVIPFPSTVTL